MEWFIYFDDKILILRWERFLAGIARALSRKVLLCDPEREFTLGRFFKIDRPIRVVHLTCY